MVISDHHNVDSSEVAVLRLTYFHGITFKVNRRYVGMVSDDQTRYIGMEDFPVVE